MARLKPWYQVAVPREDLREGKPLDASEFAVHLDHIRDERAPRDYQDPERFFERTHMTASLKDLGAQVIRRLSGVTVETSSIFNMSTQFGGGKTHALTMLYHLARSGPAASGWRGVKGILDKAQVKSIPRAATAVFVGTEFDSITGRGEPGEPTRHTPWGEIAWQLGGVESFRHVETHDREFIEPKGDVIRALLPKDQPALILMDEIINYVSTYRGRGYNNRLFNFLQSLSEVARSQENLALVVSIPASELEYTVDDQADEARFKKMLDRVGKAIMMSAEAETAEIVRHRLFEWNGLPQEGQKVAQEFASWAREHRQLLGDSSGAEVADRFGSTYPFHPSVLSVFERKWQSLPRFQKTRGILRLLALWVSSAYQQGYKDALSDPLIGLGTAPLDDPIFRAAVFEQLGNSDLEGAVIADIAGSREAWAVKLDRESSSEIRRFRLHQKIATSIFFESNGGQTRAEATLPEIRAAAGEPAFDIANTESALEALSANCYYLSTERNRYRFGLTPNLNKLVIDRRAAIGDPAVEDRVLKEVQSVFRAGPGAEVAREFFPARSIEVNDRPVLTIVVCSPIDPPSNDDLETLYREHGASGRTFKNALICSIPDDAASLLDAARTVLAWEDIQEDSDTQARLDEGQRRQLKEQSDRASKDLRETVWRTYRRLGLLGRGGKVRTLELGLPHSSAANSLTDFILNRLRQDDEVTEGVGPMKLVRSWPASLEAWSTLDIRNAFFSAPALPRLLDPGSVRRTIVDGVSQGLLAYATGDGEGRFSQVITEGPLTELDIEISEETYVLRAEDARKYIEPPELSRLEILPASAEVQAGETLVMAVRCLDQHGGLLDTPEAVAWSASNGSIDQDGRFVATEPGASTIRAEIGSLSSEAHVLVQRPGERGEDGEGAFAGFRWEGQIPPQKWMNFYTKVLSRFASIPGLRISVRFEVPESDEAVTIDIEDARTALRELGLNSDE
jgi:hypothetical protein